MVQTALKTAVLILTVQLAPSLCAEAVRPWTDVKNAGRFVFRADFPLQRHAKLMQQMIELQNDLSQDLNVRSMQEPIEVYLFSNQTTYQRYMQRYFPGIPKRRAMFIKAQSPGNVFAHENVQLPIDLRHECTHAILHASLPYVPLWLDEGLAEYYEVAPSERARANPHLRAVRWHLRFSKPTPLSTLERLGDLGDMGRSEYRDAWGWVHFLLHGPAEARAELLRFLSDIQNQKPPLALSVRLRKRMPDAERQLVEHFRNW